MMFLPLNLTKQPDRKQHLKSTATHPTSSPVVSGPGSSDCFEPTLTIAVGFLSKLRHHAQKSNQKASFCEQITIQLNMRVIS